MSFADLQQLFAHPQFALPYLEADDKKSFLHHYKERMKVYIEQLKTIPQPALDSFNKDRFIDDISYIATELTEILRLYLDGFPSQSYIKFKQLAELPLLLSRLTNWRTISLDTGTVLYRTKREYGFTPVSGGVDPNGFVKYIDPIELFHVPFEKRKAIGTNRFSIPGFPCIYLSGTLHTSWSEALENTVQSFHAAAFKNHRPVYVADVVPVNLAKPATATEDFIGHLYNYNDFNDALIDYAIVFPLITACHTKISYSFAYFGEVKFKSEYIIPQLLLQWYRDNQIMVDGIRYLSCTADSRFPAQVFDKFNYVIPAIEMKEEGHCAYLKHNYSVSEVYSYLQPTGEPEFEMLQKMMSVLDSASFQSLK